MTDHDEINNALKNRISYSITASNELPQAVCVVCGDVSDGPHFGAYTCRACAAFFRRTVSLKLDYTCRADSKCNIEKSARNMCRSCRFQKCLRLGMLVTAVQQTRDGIGKRNSLAKTRTDRHLQNRKPENADLTYPFDGAKWNTVGDSHPMVTGFSCLEITPKPENWTEKFEMRILPKMLEGYHHYLSIRKASFSLAEGDSFTPTFEDHDKHHDTMRRSNFDLVRKVCRMESHIATDIVNNYFFPFKELPAEEKIVLFKNFFSYYTNSDRAFQSYRAFGRDPNNDRLLMPDGGYIKMSELEKFYENTINCKADPMEAARIFRPVMTFIVNAIVGHMRRIEMSEYEYVAMLGMFLWNDALSNIAKETIEVVWSTRSAIFEDLHIHYRSRGLSDIQASVKLGNLMLLIPKIQRAVALFSENFQLAELFNIFEADHCCSAFRPE